MENVENSVKIDIFFKKKDDSERNIKQQSKLTFN